jgi:hypothetical protein
VTRDEADRLVDAYRDTIGFSAIHHEGKFQAEGMIPIEFDGGAARRNLVDAMFHEDKPLQVTPEIVASFYAALFKNESHSAMLMCAEQAAMNFVALWNARKEVNDGAC